MSTLNYLDMVITDLDGTLACSNGTISETDLKTLNHLGSKQVARVVATGRNLHSARNVLAVGSPIDYLIFSCGAGILDFKTGKILQAQHIDAQALAKVYGILMSHTLDFMVHFPIPDNHRFYYYGTGRENPDFARRCERSGDFAISARLSYPAISQATQFLVVAMEEEGEKILELVKNALGDEFSVLRTTSPFDHKSFWIEVYAKGVSKGSSSHWLANHLGISSEHVLGVGNDYNDIELLDWVGHPYLMSNGPKDLKARYPQVASNNESGFSDAVKKWLTKKND